MQWLETLAGQGGWSTKAHFALSLCLDEAMTNIISYGSTAEGAKAHISLSCGPTARGVGLLLRDSGRAFDPTAREPGVLANSLEEARIGGHGLRLMRHYLSLLAYRREDGLNLLWLELELI